ncbi:MAG: transcriptional regulator [Nostoc sp.]|uniref:transcriptional regulator n=1 Tax=Nostoc sp. TaxID=1180 RepID=UPI002FFBDA4A
MDQYSGTRQKSQRQPRTSDGKFETDYGDSPKCLRSIRLTDEAWEKLLEIGNKNQVTRSEVIEIFARGGDLY